MEPEPSQEPLTQAEPAQQETQLSTQTPAPSTSTSSTANALISPSPSRVSLPLVSTLTPQSYLGPSLSTHSSLISPSTHPHPHPHPSQLSANPLSTPNSQATAEAQAANIASGKAPVPLSLASRPKPTSAFGVAEEAGVLSQGANPLPYTVPPGEEGGTEVEQAGEGEVAVPGPKRVITEEELDAMSAEERVELEKNPKSWISSKEVKELSVDEIRKAGFGRNSTGEDTPYGTARVDLFG